jgi:HEAT repeat protein
MRKRVHIALAVLLLALAGVSVWQGLSLRDLVYQGKRLSSWLQAYRLHGVAGVETWQVRTEQQMADEAVRKAGTNALPTLLRMLRAKDSALKVKLVGLAQRQHFVRIRYTPAEELNYQASCAFGVLRAKGQNAVPALMEIADKHISHDSRWYAIAALAFIDPPAKEVIPSLSGWATNADSRVRLYAVHALGEIRAERDRVVPVLTNALRDPDNQVVIDAAAALGKFGPNAKLAVPALVEFLNAPSVNRPYDAYSRLFATNALKAIDPEAAAKMGVR